jgi:hypothetical protein
MTRHRFFLISFLGGLLAGAASLLSAADSDPLMGLRSGHPRLLFTDEQLAASVEAARADPLRAALHRRVIAMAEAELTSPPIERVLVGPRLLDQSRLAVSRVLTCSLAYRLTQDARFAERAKREMLTAAAFPDWNPSHFLDVAEMSFALAVGYDWLFSALSTEERAAIKNALVHHALVFADDAYAEPKPRDKRVWFATAHHNWNQVCNAGLLAAALAIADEEPATARRVIAGVRASLPLAMQAYLPDGAYPEGPGYWSYGTSFNVIAIALFESALGTDFGLAAQPGFDRTAQYRLHIQGPAGLAFNHADGVAEIGLAPEYTWLATRYPLPDAIAHSRALLAAALDSSRTRGLGRLFALHAAWFPRGDSARTGEAPLDIRFRGPAELALFRSDRRDANALFVGLKGGSNAVNHAHLDLGSFVLDADGLRWATDLGPDDYNLPGYFRVKRWSYYRLINHSHNTLTPANRLQDPKAVAPIVAFESAPDRAFAIVDLSPAYPGSGSLRRGIALLDRSRVLVQDEWTDIAAKGEITWRMLTPAQVTLTAPGHATLTRDGQRLRAEILEPAGAVFTAAEAKPPTAEENQNRGITVLAVSIQPGQNQRRLAIRLIPEGERWPASVPTERLIPLAEWR